MRVVSLTANQSLSHAQNSVRAEIRVIAHSNAHVCVSACLCVWCLCVLFVCTCACVRVCGVRAYMCICVRAHVCACIV